MNKEQKLIELERWIKYTEFLMYYDCKLLAADILNRVEVLKMELDYGNDK